VLYAGCGFVGHSKTALKTPVKRKTVLPKEVPMHN